MSRSKDWIEGIWVAAYEKGSLVAMLGRDEPDALLRFRMFSGRPKAWGLEASPGETDLEFFNRCDQLVYQRVNELQARCGEVRIPLAYLPVHGGREEAQKALSKSGIHQYVSTLDHWWVINRERYRGPLVSSVQIIDVRPGDVPKLLRELGAIARRQRAPTTDPDDPEPEPRVIDLPATNAIVGSAEPTATVENQSTPTVDAPRVEPIAEETMMSDTQEMLDEATKIEAMVTQAKANTDTGQRLYPPELWEAIEAFMNRWDLSYREVADYTGMNKDTVRWHFHDSKTARDAKAQKKGTTMAKKTTAMTLTTKTKTAATPPASKAASPSNGTTATAASVGVMSVGTQLTGSVILALENIALALASRSNGLKDEALSDFLVDKADDLHKCTSVLKGLIAADLNTLT